MKRLFYLLILLLACVGNSQQVAFPNAIGAGAYATGGEGGVVCYVNTLDWDPTGSYTYDASTDSYSGSLYELIYELDIDADKQILFKVAGIISVPTGLQLDFSNLTYQKGITISGQTAPGKVVIETDYFQIANISNLIWRYCDFYKRDDVHTGADVLWVNSLSGEVVENIIFDHCSFFYGGDECLSIAGSSGGGEVNDVTVQWCLMAASSKGSIIGAYSGESDATTAYSAYVDISYRFPNMLGYGSTTQQDAINIFIENYTSRLIRVTGDAYFNVQNMYVQANKSNYGRHQVQYQDDAESQIHSSGTYINQGVKEDPTTDDFPYWQVFDGSSLPTGDPIPASVQVATPMTQVGKNYYIYPTLEVKDSVLPYVGNTKYLNSLGNPVDSEYALTTYYKDRAINQVSTTTQQNKPTVEYPAVTSGTAYTDTDSDGMPDDYEDAVGLDKGDYTDGSEDSGSGQSNLTVFLNRVETDNAIDSGPSTVHVTSVSMTSYISSLGVDRTSTLKYEILPSDATDQTGTWSSSNSSVATVDQTGKVTGVSDGTATITFTTTDGAFTASVLINVIEVILENSSKGVLRILISN